MKLLKRLLAFIFIALSTQVFAQVFTQEYQIIKNKNLFDIYKSGKKISKTSYEQATKLPDNYFCIKKNNKYGILNSEGKLSISERFDNILYFSKDIFLVKEGRKWGLVNSAGRVILPVDYVGFQHYKEDLHQIKGSKGIGLINKQGVVLISPEYENLTIFSGNIYQARKQSKVGLINDLGEEIIPAVYDTIYRLGSTLFSIGEIGFKRQIIDIRNKRILEEVFDEIDTSYGNFLVLKKGSKIGFYINNAFTPIVYDRIIFYQPIQGIIAIKQGNKYGLILRNGRIINPIYDNISRFNGGVAFAEKNGRLINLNMEGEEISL